MKEHRKSTEAAETFLKEVIDELSGQSTLQAYHAPETPEEALARKDFGAFFDCHDSGISDLIVRADRITAAGQDE